MGTTLAGLQLTCSTIQEYVRTVRQAISVSR